MDTAAFRNMRESVVKEIPHWTQLPIRLRFAASVHPSYAGKRIGTRILIACEQAAPGAGFERFELVSTLTAVPLYHRTGYVNGQTVRQNYVAIPRNTESDVDRRFAC